jgi:SAM-dependent methyltransferase
MRFWRRPGIVLAQEFRVRRYVPFLVEAARIVGLSAEGEVLDVGCGPTCCAAVIPIGRKWYLDPLLAEYQTLHDLPNGEYLAVSIEDAEVPEAYFDLAVCLNALDHMRNPWKALAIIHRALKPGGVFLCSVYTRRPLLAFLRNLQEYLWLSTDVAHPHSFTVAALSRELRLVGFNLDPPRTIDADRERTEWIWRCRKVGG